MINYGKVGKRLHSTVMIGYKDISVTTQTLVYVRPDSCKISRVCLMGGCKLSESHR